MLVPALSKTPEQVLAFRSQSQRRPAERNSNRYVNSPYAPFVSDLKLNIPTENMNS